MTPQQEAILGRAMVKHRVVVDGWDGNTWQGRSKPTGIVASMCRLLICMDGGAMWSSDLMLVDIEAFRAIRRLKRLCLVDVIGFERGKGELIMCTEKADGFLMRYDSGQGWLL
jgi:hypothetical protein